MKNLNLILNILTRRVGRTILAAWLVLLALAPAAWATQVTLTPSSTSPWSVPSGVTSIQVEMWGAGGGGGGVKFATALTGGGAGGGGGAYTKAVLAVTPGGSIAYVVPSGGAGGLATGTAGSTPSAGTQFAGAATANSGNGGPGKTAIGNLTGGAGGTAAASPAYSLAGGAGGNGTTAANAGGGGGGTGSATQAGGPGQATGIAGSAGTGGTAGGTGGAAAANAGGGNAPAFGAGGGGGVVTSSTTGQVGGNGGDGKILITYTVNTYYADGRSGHTDPAVAANWWTSTTPGSGSNPSDFTDGNFVIQNGTNMTATADWTTFASSATSLSSLIINSGGTLDMANHNLTIKGNFSNSGTYQSTGASGAPTVTFNSTSLLTPGVTSINVAAIGGGGCAAGSSSGVTPGGGGGGGCAYSSSMTVVAATAYAVNVGPGGPAPGGNVEGNNSGVPSSFSGGAITALVGGGGGPGKKAGTAGTAGTASGGGTANNSGGAGGVNGGGGGGGAGTTSTGTAGSTSTGSAGGGGAGGTGSPAGGNGGNTAINAQGQSGFAYGGGGGAGIYSGANQNGGPGGSGAVVVSIINPPTVTTPTATAITDTTATLGATVTANGGSVLTSRGTVWGTSANPTGNAVAEGGTSVSAFTQARTGLTAGTLIHYRGYAVNVAGTSYSADATFYTLSTEPTAHVTGPFTATAVSSSEIDLSWTAASGPPNGYLILQRAGSSAPTGAPSDATAYTVGNTIGDGTVVAVITSGSTASFNVTSGLSASSAYSYAIFPYNWDGAHAATYNYYTAATVPTASASTPSASSPPGAPNANAASITNSSGFTASWSAGTGAATSYTVDVATDSAFTSFVSGWNSNNVSLATSANVTGLNAGQAYYYRIYAHNSAGDSPASATITVVTILAAPVASVASSTNASGFTAAWSASSGATKYYLDVATDSGFTALVSGYNNLDVGNVTSAAVTGLSVDTTYYYRVRAYTTAFGSTASSSTISVHTLATAPVVTASAATGVTTNSATLNGSITTTGGIITDSGFVYGTTTGITIASNKTPMTVAYTANGSWLCPVGVTSVQVECWGAGGAGGSAAKTISANPTAGGGAGGAYVKKITVPVTGGNTYTFSVGAGGVNNSSVNGTAVAGGDTTFTGDSSTVITAKGGGGGLTLVDITGGSAGGSHTTGSTVGDVNNEGGNGATAGGGISGGGGGGAGNATPSTSGVGGNGGVGGTINHGVGGTGTIAGGNGGDGLTGGAGANGFPGSFPGGGGGGARNAGVVNTVRSGGTGGSGLIVITYNATAPVALTYNQLTGLGTNVQYFYKAYAINSAGTSLSSEQSFYTLANTPTAPTVNGATTTTLNVNVIASANGNPASTQYAIQETNSALYVQADGTLSASAVWQTTNTWGSGTGVITVTGLTPGTTNAFQIKAENGASVATAFSPATVRYTVPTAPSAGNSGPICAGSTLNLTASALSGATYSWTGPNGFASTSQNPTIPNATTAASGLYSVTVTLNGQTSAAGSTTATVNTLPTAYSVTGGGSCCAGGLGVAIGLANSDAGVNYQLFRNSGATAVGSPVAGTGSAITFGSQTTADTYTVVAVNATTTCTSGMAGSATVTVNALPSTSGIIGTNSVQQLASATYSVGNTSGSTFGWTVPAGASFSGGAGHSISVTFGTTSGNVSVIETNASGCTGTAQSQYVTVITCTTPDATLTPATNAVCAGSTGNTASAPTGADTYAWSISGGTITAGVSTHTVTYTAGGAGTLTLTCAATNGGSCYDVKSATVTVNALPTTGSITGTNLVTHGTTNTYSVANTGGSTYGWTVPEGATFTGGTSSTIGVIFGTNSGSITVVETNASGCTGSQQTLAVTVAANNAPVANTVNVLRTPGEMVLIALSDLATNWSDADGDLVRMTAFNGVTSNGMNLTPLYLTTTNDWTETSYLTAAGGFLGYTNPANINDQFTYSVGDGFGGTNIGYVNIVVSPFVAGTQTITGQQTTNGITGGSFTVTYYGIPGYTYLLERSTNLTTWADISTNTIGSGGVTNVIDNFSDLPGAPSAAYYRVGWKTSY